MGTVAGKLNITQVKCYFEREFQTFVTFCLLVSISLERFLVYSKPLPIGTKWCKNKKNLLRQTQKIKPM